MKTALVLGASAESIHSIRVAQDLGYHVIALDGDPNAPGLAVADESAAIDIMDPGLVVAFMGARVPDCIIPVPIGRALVAVGQLNDYWQIPGVGYVTSMLCTDKYLFARRLNALGLRESKCYLAEQVFRDPSLLSTMATPLIVKPRFGSGSRGVSLLNSTDDALAVLSEGDIVEEAFEGREYGFDGIVVDGSLHVLSIREKVNTPPPACQCVGYFTLPSHASEYRVITPFVREVVSSLRLTNGLLHADIMLAGDDPFVIELSARPSGHSISSDLLPFASGSDPCRLFLRCIVGHEKIDSPGEVHPTYLGFFDLGSGVVRRLPASAELASFPTLRDYVCHLNVGDAIDETVDGSVTNRGRFIFSGDLQEVREESSRLLGMFELE